MVQNEDGHRAYFDFPDGETSADFYFKQIEQGKHAIRYMSLYNSKVKFDGTYPCIESSGSL